MKPYSYRPHELQVANKYDTIAPVYGACEWMTFQPFGLRKRAVDALELKRGDTVVDYGCGTGRNFPHLLRAVGAVGTVIGVDVSRGMLKQAYQRGERAVCFNIDLFCGDAAEYKPPGLLGGALFSFSATVMSNHPQAMAQVWESLNPGTSIVVVDARLPVWSGPVLETTTTWWMKQTLLGDPKVRPWETLKALGGEFSMEECLVGSYYIARARKSARVYSYRRD